MNRFWRNLWAILLIPALLLAITPCAARADDSSDGAAITAGLFIAVLVVLFTLGLSSDIQNVTRHAPGDPPALAGFQKPAARVVAGFDEPLARAAEPQRVRLALNTTPALGIRF